MLKQSAQVSTLGEYLSALGQLRLQSAEGRRGTVLLLRCGKYAAFLAVCLLALQLGPCTVKQNRS